MKFSIAKEVPKSFVYVSEGIHDDTRFVEDTGVKSIVFAAQKEKAYTRRTAFKTIRAIVRFTKERNILQIAIAWELLAKDFPETEDVQTFAQLLASHAVAANYDFVAHKTGKTPQPLTDICIVGAPTALAPALARGVLLGTSLNWARTVANDPASHVTPALFSKHVQSLFKKIPKTTVKIFDDAKLRQMKMGALLGVGQGSTHKPQLAVVEYMGGKKGDAPIVFVGKGITFDSGGLQVKPSSGGSMHEMHLDMMGGATVVAAVHALATLGEKKNVVAIVPLAENMISSTSYRPGDILTSYSGKTIEVLNTDAEGRLVLADALSYAQKVYQPKLIVDVATLTGAALVALGDMCSALFSRDAALSKRIIASAEATGELVWELPLWDEYKYMLKSDRADIANIPSDGSRYGGCINGAIFLAEFIAKNQAWAHLDIAPRMTATSRDSLAKGSTGEPVRLLVDIARSH
ncbi:MAG: leucyl aminopeptidase family protein [Minisyncoccia bacterium]